MKTHRQEMIEKLDNECGPTVNQTPATIEHLLLLCDMLDERDADADQCAATNSLANGKTFRCAKKAGHPETHYFGATEENYTADQFRDVTKKIEDLDAGDIAQIISDTVNGRIHTDAALEARKIIALMSSSHPAASRTEVKASTSFPEELVERCRAAQQTAIRHALTTRHECHPLVLAHVAPILAAKDALIQKYDNERNSGARDIADISRAIFKSKHIAMRKGDGHPIVAAIKDADDRIAELESTSDTNHKKFRDATTAFDNEREQHRRTASELGTALERVAGLEKQLSDVSMERDGQRNNVQKLWNHLREEFDKELIPTWNCTWDLLSRVTRHADARIAELTAPFVVDGKTPGQVFGDVFDAEFESHKRSGASHFANVEASQELAARAVLRAFGNGAEALGRVREQILAAPGEACEYYAAIIDDEIAKLT